MASSWRQQSGSGRRLAHGCVTGYGPISLNFRDQLGLVVGPDDEWD